MRRIAGRITALVAGIALAGSAQAQGPGPRACVTAPQAEALVLFVAPELIRQIGQRCAATLPASALVRQTNGAFIARYEAEAERVWPQARDALDNLSGAQASQLLGSAFAAPLVASIVAPMVVGNVNAADCPAIERAATLMQPLPPRNVAGLVVLFAQADAASPRPQMRLPLCAALRKP